MRWRFSESAPKDLISALNDSVTLGAPLHTSTDSPRRGRWYHAIEIESGRYFVKRVRTPRYDHLAWFRYWTQQARTPREFRRARRLHALGVAIPEPMALGQEHRFLRYHECQLVYRELPADWMSLASWIESAPPSDEHWRVVTSLAAFIAGQHEAGIFHLDLTAPNVMLRLAATPQYCMVDIESIYRRSPRNVGVAVQSLARLQWGSSRLRDRDGMLFLAHYLRRRPTFPVDLHELWRLVAAHRPLLPYPHCLRGDLLKSRH